VVPNNFPELHAGAFPRRKANNAVLS